MKENNWRGPIIIGGLLFIVYFVLGMYIDFARGYIPGDALSRLVNAWLVTHGTEVKLASIGFIWPPIPTLMLLPWTLIPSLFSNWLAVVIVSALSMAFASIMLWQLADICGISKWWRAIFVILFAVNPLIIVFAINGMSEAILVAAIITACYWLVRFWQTGRNTHLIFAAGFFGILPLIRYEIALISAWSGLLILFLSWEKHKQFTQEKFGQFLEGRLLAYSSLAIYPIFLWAIANWFIMGNPFYFLSNERTAVGIAEFQLSDFGIITTPLNSLRIVSDAWFWTFPLGLIASVVLMVYAWRKRSNFLFGFGFMPLIIPLLQFALLTRRANVPLLRYFLMVIPLGVVVTLVVIFVISPLLKGRWGKPFINVTFLLLLLGSDIFSVMQLNSYPYQTFDGATWRALTGKGDARDQQVIQAYDIGKLLEKTIPPDSKILMDTYGYGFAILLGADNHNIFMDFTDPNYNEALLDPPKYVDYVLLPSHYQRGEYYAVNMYQKTLYDEGATWAELVDALPPTIDGWKLYKVIK
jgi:hypothetical protein